MRQTFLPRSLFIIFLVTGFSLATLSKDFEGDLAVYQSMHAAISLQSFIFQPLFTLYFNLVSYLITHAPSAFLVMTLIPSLLAFNLLFINLRNDGFVFYLAVAILAASILYSPLMHYYLLRQNLAMLFFLYLALRGNIRLAFLVSTLFHFAFIPVGVVFFTIKNLGFNRFNSRKVIFIKLLFIIVLSFFLSHLGPRIFNHGMTIDIPVLKHYTQLYANYNDSFGSQIDLQLLLIFCIASGILLGPKSIASFTVITSCVSLFVVANIFDFSPAMQYRYLSMAKLPAILTIMFVISHQSRIRNK